MWRPKDYQNPFDMVIDRQRGKHYGRARDYEDGWDDCLEALKQQGFAVEIDKPDTFRRACDNLYILAQPGQKGTVILIPDEDTVKSK